ncbi:MAG: GNAT family N-acetyltransferase [Lachnospiraceae bacterium]|nr:GNAT family N-acetyltransferase [Lachnospiraceae bacterium]MBP3569054.1 GNAT family N-acetyltransferase [Lachnospiraceae bacterium]
MELRLAGEQDYIQLAELKWLHGEEDDMDYGENNLAGADKNLFTEEFVGFLQEHKEYLIFAASDGEIVASAMFVYRIPKVPKPNGKARYIAYLTNVYTRKEYRNQGIGTELLSYIKGYLTEQKCELLFVWPSEKSRNWYERSGFSPENEIFECVLGSE